MILRTMECASNKMIGYLKRTYGKHGFTFTYCRKWPVFLYLFLTRIHTSHQTSPPLVRFGHILMDLCPKAYNIFHNLHYDLRQNI